MDLGHISVKKVEKLESPIHCYCCGRVIDKAYIFIMGTK